MDKTLTILKMTEYLHQARQTAWLQEYGWKFEIKETTVLITMSSRIKPDVKFLLRVDFVGFPARAPSCLFVNLETKKFDANSWPADVAHGDNPSNGICTPGTREFHEQIHKNQEKYTWDSEKYPFVSTLLNTQLLMEKGVGK